MESSQHILQDWKVSREKLRQQMPGVFDSFRKVSEQVFQDGALSRKHKELIALGIAVKIQCRLCITLHVKQALETGATPAEILEAASVAVQMGGAPAFGEVSTVLQALEEMQPQNPG